MTVVNWHKNATVEDMKTVQTHPRSVVLIEAEVATVTPRCAARTPTDEPQTVASFISSAHFKACALVRNVLDRVIHLRRIVAGPSQEESCTDDASIEGLNERCSNRVQSPAHHWPGQDRLILSQVHSRFSCASGNRLLGAI